MLDAFRLLIMFWPISRSVMLTKGAHIVDNLCHIGDQCMWGLWNLYFMIRGEGHTPLMVDILFLLVGYILCRFIVWSEEW